MQTVSLESSTTNTSLNKHFEIEDLQDLMKSELHETSKMYSANHYEILYLQSGAGKLTVNLQQHQLNSNSIYFISPGQIRTIALQESANGFYLSVSEDFFTITDHQFSFVCMLQQFKGLGNAMAIPLNDSNQREVDEIILQLNKQANLVHPLQRDILQSLFRMFLLYVSKGYETGREIEASSNDTRIVKMFMQLVKHHYIQKKMVADYARELCVTRSYLNKVVKKVSGFTASQIIQQCVIQEAKKQAIQSDSSMKQIAYSLGFDDSAHFSKFFKTNCGINFTNYKKEITGFQ